MEKQFRRNEDETIKEFEQRIENETGKKVSLSNIQFLDYVLQSGDYILAFQFPVCISD
jgi:hypothetical protein